MSSGEDSPVQQFVAAWHATAAVVSEWAERTAAVTSEAFRKLASDPAIRAVLDTWRFSVVWDRRDCECSCARSHPDDVGICDKNAVITRRVAADSGAADSGAGDSGAADSGGDVEVPLCAPCAVAQGVAEMPR